MGEHGDLANLVGRIMTDIDRWDGHVRRTVRKVRQQVKGAGTVIRLVCCEIVSCRGYDGHNESARWPAL